MSLQVTTSDFLDLPTGSTVPNFAWQTLAEFLQIPTTFDQTVVAYSVPNSKPWQLVTYFLPMVKYANEAYFPMMLDQYNMARGVEQVLFRVFVSFAAENNLYPYPFATSVTPYAPSTSPNLLYSIMWVYGGTQYGNAIIIPKYAVGDFLSEYDEYMTRNTD